MYENVTKQFAKEINYGNKKAVHPIAYGSYFIESACVGELPYFYSPVMKYRSKRTSASDSTTQLLPMAGRQAGKRKSCTSCSVTSLRWDARRLFSVLKRLRKLSIYARFYTFQVHVNPFTPDSDKSKIDKLFSKLQTR